MVVLTTCEVTNLIYSRKYKIKSDWLTQSQFFFLHGSVCVYCIYILRVIYLGSLHRYWDSSRSYLNDIVLAHSWWKLGLIPHFFFSISSRFFIWLIFFSQSRFHVSTTWPRAPTSRRNGCRRGKPFRCMFPDIHNLLFWGSFVFGDLISCICISWFSGWIYACLNFRSSKVGTSFSVNCRPSVFLLVARWRAFSQNTPSFLGSSNVTHFSGW